MTDENIWITNAENIAASAQETDAELEIKLKYNYCR